jgi:NAD(P)-dependent dehydrogenase (short-subunit alcohol dehydrogenase family)
MTRIDASQLLRPGLLQGVSVVLAGAPSGADAGPSLAGTVGAACAGLGARVLELPVQADRAGGAEEPELDRAVDRLLADAGSLELLVIDGAGLFARTLSAANDDAGSGSGSDGSRAALSVCLDTSWNATRAVVNRAFLPGGRGGRIVYLTPARDAGEHAEAACSGLENLARTLSIEWARHGITTVAVVPASGSAGDAAGEVAALLAYLASPAGAYFSGCLLDLSGVGLAGSGGVSRSSRRTDRR